MPSIKILPQFLVTITWERKKVKSKRRIWRSQRKYKAGIKERSKEGSTTGKRKKHLKKGKCTLDTDVWKDNKLSGQCIDNKNTESYI